MTDADARLSIKKLYQLTAGFGLIGFVWYFWIAGGREASAFAFGAASSFGNLWLFDRSSGFLAPGPATRKPWTAGVYVLRYVFLIAFGYVIVRALGANPLAVILGLLSSAAAVLASLVFELLAGLLGSRTTH